MGPRRSTGRAWSCARRVWEELEWGGARREERGGAGGPGGVRRKGEYRLGKGGEVVRECGRGRTGWK